MDRTFSVYWLKLYFYTFINEMNTDKVKKIGLVTVSLGKGGAERSVVILSKILHNLAHQVFVITLNSKIEQEFSGELFDLGQFKDEKDNFIKRFYRLRKLRQFLLEKKIDLIIDHRPKNQLRREQLYKAYVYKNIKTIDVVHSALQAHYFEKFGTKMLQLFKKNVATIGVSKYIEENILQENGIKNTHYIPNCYDPSFFEECSEIPHQLKNKTYFLSYGRIDEKVKNLSFLIEAYGKSKLWKKNVFLVIMGDGNDKDMLIKKVATTEFSDYVEFLPHISSPSAIIQNARAICLTSNYEGFPMVLVESLSLGTPVISLDITSGPSEIIQPNINGILIKKRDTNDFASAMRKMFLEEDFYQNCMSNAPKSVEKFNLEAISEKWKKLIENILNRKLHNEI